jgi:hypothetical protein
MHTRPIFLSLDILPRKTAEQIVDVKRFVWMRRQDECQTVTGALVTGSLTLTPAPAYEKHRRHYPYKERQTQSGLLKLMETKTVTQIMKAEGNQGYQDRNYQGYQGYAMGIMMAHFLFSFCGKPEFFGNGFSQPTGNLHLLLNRFRHWVFFFWKWMNLNRSLTTRQGYASQRMSARPAQAQHTQPDSKQRWCHYFSLFSVFKYNIRPIQFHQKFPP